MVDEAGILVAEAVVVLAPDMRGQQIVERGDRPAPGNLRGTLQPFRVLVEHRIDDVDERLVAGEEAVPPGQQIAFEPALAGVLAEDLHHPAVRREMIVVGQDLGHPRAVGRPRTRAPAGWTRSRPGRRCGNCARRRCSFMTSRRNSPMHRAWPRPRRRRAAAPSTA